MEEIIKALRTAIKGERTALITYLESALNSDDFRAKDMFIMLAKDEFHHYEILNLELNSLKSSGEFSEYEFAPSDISRLIPNLNRFAKSTSKEKKFFDEKQVIDIALNHENEAKKFYLEQFMVADNEIAKKMWKELAEMEEAHYQLLMTQTFHIKETGYWLNIKEFSVEFSEE